MHYNAENSSLNGIRKCTLRIMVRRDTSIARTVSLALFLFFSASSAQLFLIPLIHARNRPSILLVGHFSHYLVFKVDETSIIVSLYFHCQNILILPMVCSTELGVDREKTREGEKLRPCVLGTVSAIPLFHDYLKYSQLSSFD